MAFWSQVRLMLWKNWLLHRRKPCVSVFEILLPLGFSMLLLYIRSKVPPVLVKSHTEYAPFNITDKYIDRYSIRYQVGYAPSNMEVDKLISIAKTLIGPDSSDGNVTFKGFVDEKTMVDYAQGHTKEMRICLVFNGIKVNSLALPNHLDFVIRPAEGYVWLNLLSTFPLEQTTTPSKPHEEYRNYGVLFFQKLVAKALLLYRLQKMGHDYSNKSFFGVSSQRFPFPPYADDKMIKVIQSIFPLFVVLSFILSVIVNTKNLVYEKEKKLKESMKLMGLKGSVHFLSWFITFCIYLIPVVFLYTIFIGTKLSVHGAILEKSSISLLFVFLLLYAFSMLTFCFMISTFVQKANNGAGLAGALFFLLYCPLFYIKKNYQHTTKLSKMGFSILFNCAMGLGAKVIGLYEGTGDGVQWSNFHRPASVDDNFSLLECMIMLVVDSFLHLLVYWYLENVRPGDFGVPKPFYFCFTKSYWFGSSQIDQNNSYMQGDRFEPEPTNLKKGIQINKLRKEFANHIAVKEVSVNMFEGQISVLLGHNGAGKTTTMSMLTGFIPPTSGTAIVNGYDITTNIDGVRSSLGLCPQHDILFDILTVEEHLQFFSILKGASIEETKDEIKELVTEVGLEAKFKERSQNLSGGQKRKLSVAIALVAGSKIVMLDEPSSGMDPAARRQTWDVLQKHREGRTMVLTTHYMDEADVLGDRIFIMAEGVIKCYGSSMFLKKLYGAGYHLVVVRNFNCIVRKVTKLIVSHIGNAKLEHIINQELTYLLPDKETDKFSKLFKDLEAKKDELGISSFGTSATTMEEVFLKVGESTLDDGDDAVPKIVFSDDEGINIPENDHYVKQTASMGTLVDAKPILSKSNIHSSSMVLETAEKKGSILDFNKGFTKKTGLSLELAKMKSLFVKKALHTWRNRTISLVQVFFPVMFTILGLTIDALKPESFEIPPLTFNLKKFSDGTIIPVTTAKTKLGNYYAKQFDSNQKIDKISDTYSRYNEYVLHKTKEMGIGTFNKRVIIGFEETKDSSFISHFNGQPYHSEPIGMNYMLNALLQYYLNSTTYSLQSGIHPIPSQRKRKVGEEAMSVGLALVGSFVVGIFIGFGMAFLTSFFIHYLIKERQIGSKHLQVVSGVTPISYWVPTFLWDFINYFIPSLLLIVVFLCYSKTPYIEGEGPAIVVLLLILYGWAVLPYMYFLQFGFKEPPSGVVSVIMLNIASGLVCLVVTFVFNIPGIDKYGTGKKLDHIFMILFPNYGMAQSFVNIYMNYYTNKACEKVVCSPLKRNPCCKDTCGPFCYEFDTNYLSFNKYGIGAYLLTFAIQGFVYFTLVFFIEYHIFQKIFYFCQASGSRTNTDVRASKIMAMTDDDSDVAAERQRINTTSLSELNQKDSLLLVNLFKRYGQFVAVDHVCVGIPQQECFGLLGQNGAGKTTTFKMLTGDVMVTGGNAYLCGNNIRNNIKQVQASLGYCPQFDALLDQMTGRETLTMYARLRGVPEENIPSVVNSLIDILMLTEHADNLSGTYSGGNKRKLSTAISLVGDPKFIMLDEPSAGMDPKARRQMWNVLSQVRASGRTLILTSHSMDECDALCTKIVIMVNGRFVCLGSPQHLKNKFGQGYTLTVKLGDASNLENASKSQKLGNFVCEQLPGTMVFDDHQGYVHFQVPDVIVKLADVFDLMESTKANFNVEDYSVHQTTLEQIFLTFTRKQAAAKEIEPRSCLNQVCCMCCK